MISPEIDYLLINLTFAAIYFLLAVIAIAGPLVMCQSLVDSASPCCSPPAPHKAGIQLSAKSTAI